MLREETENWIHFVIGFSSKTFTLGEFSCFWDHQKDPGEESLALVLFSSSFCLQRTAFLAYAKNTLGMPYISAHIS